ncbi:pimeloyl-ACP methyl ester carboxylesterase [Bradyrhizobium sp. i1.15.2]|uniref:hypothetical protein n=1 Tax=Bradyrhizobium sp. i1.15.2 TaxID=3156362 RepID=UPI003396FFF6
MTEEKPPDDRNVRRKPALLTVHGANSDGVWQRELQILMTPHFDCHPYKYGGYEGKYGVVRAVIYPWSPVIALVIAILSVGIFKVGLVKLSWPLSLHAIALSFWAVAAVAGVVASGFLYSYMKRSATAEELRADVHVRALRRPHVIAHSFGSYLIGRTLDKFPDFRVENVVLVGAILPRSFPWSSILRERKSSIRKVRSECGLSDNVVRAIGLIRLFVRDVGTAGNRGFLEGADVHSVQGPMETCTRCTAENQAVVHNVRLRNFGHRDQFLTRNHARSLWLPFLWNLEVEEFISFVDDCDLAAQHHANGLYREAELLIDAIWERTYSWTGGRTLEAYVRSEIAARVKHLRWKPTAPLVSTLAEQVKFGLHNMVSDADREHFSQNNPLNERVARSLHPHIAIASYIEQIVGENEL